MNWIVGLAVALYILSGALCFISIAKKEISQKPEKSLVNIAFNLYLVASLLIIINYWLN